jgi:hypothetical protein
VVLLAGMGIACVTSVLEFLWKGKSKAKDSSMVAKGLAQPKSKMFRIKHCGGLGVMLAYSKMKYNHTIIL